MNRHGSDAVAALQQTLNPAATAARALRSESDCRMVIANLRYLLRHDRERSDLIEQTGAYLFLYSGARELRRIAEAAEDSPDDTLGHAVCCRLLSGYWRSGRMDDEAGADQSAPDAGRNRGLGPTRP
ncbi:MAG: hypothetical protein WDZ84_14885 [Rhodovibrionaceae bacterium]